MSRPARSEGFLQRAINIVQYVISHAMIIQILHIYVNAMNEEYIHLPPPPPPPKQKTKNNNSEYME